MYSPELEEGPTKTLIPSLVEERAHHSDEAVKVGRAITDGSRA